MDPESNKNFIDILGSYVRIPHGGSDFSYTSPTTTTYYSAPSPRDLEIAKEEGRKEVLRKIWNMAPNHGDILFLVNSGDLISARHSNKSHDGIVAEEVLVNKVDIEKLEAMESMPMVVKEAIKELEIGWYQNQKTELFYYEGESHWKNVDLLTNKKLTEEAILGELEYIG